MLEATIELRSDRSRAYGTFETNFPSFVLVQIFKKNSPHIIKYSKFGDQLFKNGIDVILEREA